ncbi:MAG: L-threonylcarbamoyladenylate synthase, partial [Leptothrix sp. (in: b-proteobacteria)]
MRLRTDTPAATEAAIAAGVRALVAGELIGLPTETVYGLGARADDAQAVARIFAAKGRPSDHPLIVHLAAQDDLVAAAGAYAAELSPLARRLIAACWPGPLTLIVPRRAG